MDYIKAIILGVVEGLTEFLPVSSTGHLIIGNEFLGVDPELPQWRTFLFVSQLGAIAAVVVYFWKDLWRQTFVARVADWRNHIMVKLLIGFAPAVVAGLTLNDFLEKHLEGNPLAVAGALIAGAIAMELIERRYRKDRDMTIDDVTYKQAFMIGVAQCLSIWPGMSRAACTIMGGLIVGLSPRIAAQFSFYLAIPTMLGAAGYRLLKYHKELAADSAGVVLTGTAVAFVVALGVVAWFLPYVQKHRFTPFAIYRILLGVAVIAYFALAKS